MGKKKASKPTSTGANSNTKRAPHYKAEDKAALLGEIQKYIDIIEDKQTCNRVTNKKKEAWATIVDNCQQYRQCSIK